MHYDGKKQVYLIARNISSYGSAFGWMVHKIAISKTTNSIYMKLFHWNFGKIIIRISDHKAASGSFVCDNRKTFSVRADRGCFSSSFILDFLAGKDICLFSRN